MPAREHELLAGILIEEGEPCRAVCQTQRRFEGLGEPLGGIRFHAKAVNDRFHCVLAFRIEHRQGVEFVDAAIDTHAYEALSRELLKFGGVFALARIDERRQQHGGRALRQAHDLIDHLAHGLGREVDEMIRAARDPGAREEHAQVVVDFRDGANGGARIMRGGLLLDRDRGREALDAIDVGLVHHREKLTRIGGERFDITPLPFRIQGIEGKRGLARAGQAGQDDQPVTRQIDIDVLQVVRARAADANVLHDPIHLPCDRRKANHSVYAAGATRLKTPRLGGFWPVARLRPRATTMGLASLEFDGAGIRLWRGV